MDILLASAGSDQRFAVEVLLREQPGIRVVGTATGSEGLRALIEATDADVVIVDWELPGHPVADLLAMARASESAPYLIVLGKDESVRRAAQAAGGNRFILRGDSPETLLAALHHARTQRRMAEAPVPTEAKGG
jgi:DNA-binding NarL/FixJ family response regulator